MYQSQMLFIAMVSVAFEMLSGNAKSIGIVAETEAAADKPSRAATDGLAEPPAAKPQPAAEKPAAAASDPANMSVADILAAAR